MEPVELLRSFYDDQPAADPDRSDAIRRRLQARFDAEATSSPRRRETAFTRRHVLALAGVGLVAVTTAAVLATGPVGEQSAAASQLLTRAARLAAASTSADPGTVNRIREQSLDMIGSDGGAGPTSVVARRELVTLLRIPDAGQPWERKRWETRYDYAFGDRTQMPAFMAVTDPTGRKDAAFERSASGDFAFGSPDPDEADLGSSLDAIRDLPTDPDSLLRALRADGRGPDAGSAQQVLLSATHVLGRGVASAALQVATFHALQRTPGLAITDQDATDIEGRHGVALGLAPATADTGRSAFSVQLILDPATGRYLGSRLVSTHRDALIPAGTLIAADAIDTDVSTTAADWTPTGTSRWTTYP